MEKPFIGIANSYTDIVPGHIHLNKFAEVVKAAVREAGGVPFEFNTIGVDDGISMLLSEGDPECEILVVNPVESAWSMVHSGWCRFLSSPDPSIQALEKTYADVFHWLAGAQLDFDYGDEEMMGRLARVDTDDAGRPVLRVGECAYRTVVVAGMN